MSHVDLIGAKAPGGEPVDEVFGRVADESFPIRRSGEPLGVAAGAAPTERRRGVPAGQPKMLPMIWTTKARM